MIFYHERYNRIEDLDSQAKQLGNGVGSHGELGTEMRVMKTAYCRVFLCVSWMGSGPGEKFWEAEPEGWHQSWHVIGVKAHANWRIKGSGHGEGSWRVRRDPYDPLLLLAVTSSAASSDTRLSLGIPYRPLAFLLLSGPAFRLSFLPGDPGGQLWRKPGEAESHESSPHFSRHRKGCRYVGQEYRCRGHTLVCPNLYWVWSISIEPRSFSEAFLLSMNCPSGMALAFKTLYLFHQTQKEWSERGYRLPSGHQKKKCICLNPRTKMEVEI